VSALVLVGTRKGLFLIRGDESRRSWELEGPLLTGWEVFHAMVDPRDETMYVAANNWHYGGTVQRSTDGGKTWERSEPLAMPEGAEPLARMWHVEPGHPSQPNTLWAGGDPAVLFRSDDGARTWTPVQGIVEHPTRDKWQPGAGGLTCHSITLDKDDPNLLYIGISAAGVFRSEDGGETWTPANDGTGADFLEDNTFPEVGQCVHKVLAHPAQPNRLWQQNHCGVYRSDDGGVSWERLDGNGLPSDFGFALALDPNDPDVAYVCPEEGAENRMTPNGRLGVYRTTDGGATWELHADGLPENAWAAVMREGMAYDDGGVYLGTQSGSVFALSTRDGEWVEAASQLPPILSVEASS
jgi:photosystem II stability/assembly factor-like uncharacterized protein